MVEATKVTISIEGKKIQIYPLSPKDVAEIERTKAQKESKYAQVTKNLDDLAVGAGILVQRTDVSVDGLRAAVRAYGKRNDKVFVSRLDEAYLMIVRTK